MSNNQTGVCATIALLTRIAAGFAAEPWDGSRVFPASPTVQVRSAAAMVPWSEGLEVPSIIASQKDGVLTLETDGVKFTARVEDVVLINDAIKHFSAIIQQKPTSWAYRMRGLVYSEQQDLDRAIADYSDALRLGPKLGEVYYCRACAWQDKGDYEKAHSDYTEAIRLMPNWADAFRGRSYNWHLKNEFEKSIADLDVAIRLQPHIADDYYARAECWHSMKEYDKAIADYSEAIRLEPNDAESYLGRGSVWELKGEQQKAIDDISTAIDKGLTDTDVYLMRAKLLRSIGERDRANADIETTMRRSPDDPQHRVTCAQLWLGFGEYDKAIVDCDEAIRLEPNVFPYPYVVRGAAYCANRQYAKAIADLKRAIEIAPDVPSPYAILAGIGSICEDGNFRSGKQAVEYATKGCQLTLWKDPFYLGILAAAQAESGDFASAVKYQEQAIALLKDLPQDLQSANDRLKLFKLRKAYHGKMATDVVRSEKL